VVQSDMSAQERWVRLLRPRSSMLKFRLPYSSGKTSYLAGSVYFPVWGGRTTSETRLVLRDPDQRPRAGSFLPTLGLPSTTYDHIWYSDAMYCFNTTTRVSYYEHDVSGEGIDHCYDCSAEALILGEYLRSRNCPDQLLSWAISGLSYKISRKIALKRTLALALDDEE